MYEAMRGERVNLLKLRIGRKHYWSGVAGLLVIGAAMAFLLPARLVGALALPWLMLFMWRLHDFGRSAWWLLAVPAAAAAVVAIGLAIQSSLVPALLLVGEVGLVIWLGVKKGDPGPNRFGLPLGAKAPKEAADHFS